MKKILSTLAIACSLFASTATFAQMKGSGQEAATNKGDVIMDFGIGVGGGDYDGHYYQAYSNNGNYYGNNRNYNNSNKIRIPTLSVSIQKAFWDDITIGGQVSFNAFGSEYDRQDNSGYYIHEKFTQTNTYITARGEYHFNRLIGLDPKFDLYAGLLVGVRISSNKYSGYEGNDGRYGNFYQNDIAYPNPTPYVGPTVGVFAGFRYYFVKNLAVYGEVGGGPGASSVSNIRGGLAWKF